MSSSIAEIPSDSFQQKNPAFLFSCKLKRMSSTATANLCSSSYSLVLRFKMATPNFTFTVSSTAVFAFFLMIDRHFQAFFCVLINKCSLMLYLSQRKCHSSTFSYVPISHHFQANQQIYSAHKLILPLVNKNFTSNIKRGPCKAKQTSLQNVIL